MSRASAMALRKLALAWGRTAIRYALSIFISVRYRIVYPAIDRGLAPAAAVLADLHLAWKSTITHFAVNTRPAQSSTLQDSPHAQNFVGLRHLHTSVYRTS